MCHGEVDRRYWDDLHAIQLAADVEWQRGESERAAIQRATIQRATEEQQAAKIRATLAKKASEEKWRAEKIKNSTIEFTAVFGGWGAILGAIVGLFKSCNVSSGTFDGGTWFGTLLVFGCIGTILGWAIGNGLGRLD